MKEAVSKFAFPIILILAGVLLLIIGKNNEQNNLFMLACGALTAAGIITLLNSLGVINKAVKLVVFVALIFGSLGLAWLDFKSIKDPVDFMKERERRYTHVIQRLKDIREAEFAYKAVKNTYCGNFDTLINFLKTDSFLVVKAFGTVPDSIATEEEAVKLGIVKRDTSYVMVVDSVFNKKYTASHLGKFNIDSIPYIPYTGKTKFKLESGELDRNGVKVQVFQVTDALPFDKRHVLQVGSISDPSTSGNWE